MNQQQQPPGHEKDDDNALPNRLARKIDPPGREPDDDELRDPGNATPGAPPTDNRS